MTVGVQIGSGLARSDCGAYRSTFAPCAKDGRDRPAASANAPPVKTSLRFISNLQLENLPTGVAPPRPAKQRGWVARGEPGALRSEQLLPQCSGRISPLIHSA